MHTGARYRDQFSTPIPVGLLTSQLGSTLHQLSISSKLRPLGTHTLVLGWDSTKGYQIYGVDVDGSFHACRCAALGQQANRLISSLMKYKRTEETLSIRDRNKCNDNGKRNITDCDVGKSEDSSFIGTTSHTKQKLLSLEVGIPYIIRCARECLSNYYPSLTRHMKGDWNVNDVTDASSSSSSSSSSRSSRSTCSIDSAARPTHPAESVIDYASSVTSSASTDDGDNPTCTNDTEEDWHLQVRYYYYLLPSHRFELTSIHFIFRLSLVHV